MGVKINHYARQIIEEMEDFDQESFEAEHTDVGDVWRNLERWKHMLQDGLGISRTEDAETRASKAEDLG